MSNFSFATPIHSMNIRARGHFRDVFFELNFLDEELDFFVGVEFFSVTVFLEGEGRRWGFWGVLMT